MNPSGSHDTGTEGTIPGPWWRRRWKRRLLWLVVLLGLGLMGGVASSWLLSAEQRQLPMVEQLDLDEVVAAPGTSDRIRVATLNIAHGRGSGYGHQMFIPRKRIAENLQRIGEALGEQEVHCVALQEVDHRAWWSGGASQASVIAGEAGLPLIVRGNQVDRFGLRYGTALLATGAFADPHAIAFAAGPASPGKGFVSARWQLGDGRAATVISVHLHFRPGRRQDRQLDDLAEFIQNQDGPLILMGDFNAEWKQGTGPVARLAEKVGLESWDTTLSTGTLRNSRRRIDWILTSPPLSIIDHKILDLKLSDHRLVIAEILWPKSPHQK